MKLHFPYTEKYCNDPGEGIKAVRTPTGYVYKAGMVVKYQCESGFMPVDGNFQLKCLKDGTWNGKPYKCTGT